MKKRTLSLFLAVLMCLSLLSVTATAAGELSASGGGVTVSVAKLNFEQQEPILVTVSGAMDASSWALEELQQADKLGLIPEALQGANLTADITRAEFAAVAVKVYEALSSKAALPVVNNPFTDCNDVEVLKAYNIGAVNGTSATTFTPNALLNREQALLIAVRMVKNLKA